MSLLKFSFGKSHLYTDDWRYLQANCFIDNFPKRASDGICLHSSSSLQDDNSFNHFALEENSLMKLEQILERKMRISVKTFETSGSESTEFDNQWV